MKLYFAGYSTDKEICETRANCLLESYVYFKNKNYHEWHKKHNLLGKDLFLDSGAFSVFSRGEKVGLQGYIDYLQSYKSYISVYASLDVIGNSNATTANLIEMEKQGLNPLPTFHYGSSRDELVKLLSKYEYIALGGLVPIARRRKRLEAWLDFCFAIGKGKRFHGFGVNAMWAWKKYPFYSVDATSWLMGGKFRHSVEFIRGKLKSKGKTNDKTIKNQFIHTSKYTEINKSNVVNYLQACDFITKLWAERGIKYD